MTDKTGPGRVVLVGLTLIEIGMLSLTQIQRDTPLWFIECTLFVQGLGMGATMMPSVSAALSTLQRHEIARVTSGVNAMQRVGGFDWRHGADCRLVASDDKDWRNRPRDGNRDAFDAICPGQGLWSCLRMVVGNHRARVGGCKLFATQIN